jgi:hypothetical protein
LLTFIIVFKEAETMIYLMGVGIACYVRNLFRSWIATEAILDSYFHGQKGSLGNY